MDGFAGEAEMNLHGIHKSSQTPQALRLDSLDWGLA